VSSTDIDADFDPFEHAPPKKKPNDKRPGGSGRGLAWLALLLAVAAAGWNGWQWWLDQSAGAEEQGRQRAIERLEESDQVLRESVQALESRLSTFEQRDDPGEMTALRNDLAAMQSRLSDLGLESSDARALVEAMQAIMAGLESRTGQVEANLAAVAARSESPGKRLDLAELDYLLRLASERLVLFGDARSADHALAMADAQLAALDDPLYLSVRRRIAEARRAVAEYPQPDVLELSEKIAALQARIPAMPFPGEAIAEQPQVESPEGAGIWQRVKNALKPLVKVRRRVNPEQELSLEDKDFLRQGLWLQLESARLSLIRKDDVGWAMSLQRARDSLQDRFAMGAATVSGALAEIGELEAMEIAGEAPDISAPWRQLRLLREGQEQREAAEEESAAPAAGLSWDGDEDLQEEDSGDRPAGDEGTGG
jgi:uroporphyrin-3 C-methyltransferase